MVGEPSRTMKVDIADSVKKSADDLIGLGLTDSERSLLEKAIQKWIEEFIDELPDNIEWYKQHNDRLKKFIFKAELRTEQLANELPIAS
jgi:mRNA-degrading endonuclease RelE of RelBE toxin-antitoxin system